MNHVVFSIAFLVFTFQLNAQCSCDSLVAAIEVGDSATVRNCLDSGTDPNCTMSEFREDSTNTFDENQNVITVAVTYHWRITPLTTALHEDNLDIVQLLLDAGASPNTPEVCLEEVNYGETINLRLTPLKIAKNMTQADEVTALLLANGALTEEELEARGFRIQLLSSYYDDDYFPCKDSITKLHELIETWSLEMIIEDEILTERALANNDMILFDFLVNQYSVSLDRRASGYVTVGMGMFKRTIYKEGYSPIGSVYFGDKMTIEMIDLLKSNGGFAKGEFEKYILRKSGNDNWDDKKVRKYYLLEQKLEADKELSEKKKLKYEKKMQKLYDQLEAKNGIKARLENDFSEGCR